MKAITEPHSQFQISKLSTSPTISALALEMLIVRREIEEVKKK